MATCTFFGHRDCPISIKSRLREVIVDLIVNHNVDTFYVGNQGQFDAYVRSNLRDLQHEYPHVRYSVVLAYIPSKKAEVDDYTDTMLPDGLESIPPRYAIAWRNKWMLQQADMVVAYITHTFGGAARFVTRAEKQDKTVIHLSQTI